MSWEAITAAGRRLSKKADEASVSRADWEAFRRVVAPTETNPPYHLKILLRQLEDYRAERNRDEIAILDHGCGGAVTLLYLAAIGYTNIHGVDIGDSNCERWNRVAAEHLGATEKKFFVYNGIDLPLADNSIDVVFSQQVLEHVSTEALNGYYAGESRVLRPAGLAIHSVPHRLTPYDSHTRTWFYHWFAPRDSWIKSLTAMGRNVPPGLFLRWPWIHRRLARRYFGNVEDFTLERLRELKIEGYYDGSMRLRRLLSFFVGLPIIGVGIGRILANFVMIDTVSKKRA